MTLSKNEGFTFIEVLQAMALSGIGLLALSSLTVATIHADAKARRMTTAATLAQDKMEELRSLAYTAVAEGSDEATEAGVHYSRAWAVCTDCPIKGTKEIALNVQWPEQVTEKVTLDTIITE